MSDKKPKCYYHETWASSKLLNKKWYNLRYHTRSRYISSSFCFIKHFYLHSWLVVTLQSTFKYDIIYISSFRKNRNSNTRPVVKYKNCIFLIFDSMDSSKLWQHNYTPRVSALFRYTVLIKIPVISAKKYKNSISIMIAMDSVLKKKSIKWYNFCQKKNKKMYEYWKLISENSKIKP